MWHRVIATTQQPDLGLSRSTELTSSQTDATSSQNISEALEASHLAVHSPTAATSPTQRAAQAPNTNISGVHNSTGKLNGVP